MIVRVGHLCTTDTFLLTFVSLMYLLLWNLKYIMSYIRELKLESIHKPAIKVFRYRMKIIKHVKQLNSYQRYHDYNLIRQTRVLSTQGTVLRRVALLSRLAESIC